MSAAHPRTLHELSRDALLLGLLVGLAAAYWSLFYDQVDFLPDEGVFVNPGARVLRGEFPHVDYFVHYAGALDVYTAALYGTFGVDERVPRVAVGAAGLLALVAFYTAGARIMPRAAVAGAAVLFILCGPPMAYSASPALYAAFLTLGVVALMLAWAQSKRWALLVAAGALLGIMLLVRQNSGIYMLGATVAVVVSVGFAAERLDRWRFRSSRAIRALFWIALATAPLLVIWRFLDVAHALAFWCPIAAFSALSVWRLRQETPACTIPLGTLLRNLGGLALGFAVPVGAWLGIVIARGGMGQFITDNFSQAIAFVNLTHAPYPRLGLAGIAAVAGATLIVGLLAWLATPRPTDASARWSVAIVIVVLAAVVVVLAFVPLEALIRTGYHGVEALAFRLPPLMTCVALAMLHFGERPGAPESVDPTPERASLPLRALTPFLAMNVLQLYPTMQVAYVFHMAGLLSLVGVYMLFRAHVTYRQARTSFALRGTRTALILALPVIFSCFALAKLVHNYDLAQSFERGRMVAFDRVLVDPARANVFVSGEEGERLVPTLQFLREHVPPGEPVLIYSGMNVLYFLADRPNPTRYEEWLDLSAAIAGVSLPEVIRSAVCMGVRYVVIYPAPPSPGADLRLPEFRSLVEANMERHTSFGSVSIYRSEVVPQC
ncbi:MAG: 2 protein [Chloroflexi bacterium]|nr:2 protein [Chloroflexota bacterium]